MSAKTLEQKAYARLRRRLLAGELAPGSVLSEAKLARELGLSRMPVRGAIRQLESDGLVRKVPRFGTIVVQPTLHELRESYQIRRLLEVHAARRAARRLTTIDLLVLERHVQTLRDVCLLVREAGAAGVSDKLLRRVVDADLAFHAVILQRSLSPHSAQFVMNLRLFPSLDRQTWICEPRLLREFTEVYLHHSRILRALKRRDRRAAANAMREHLRLAQRKLRRSVRAMIGRPIPAPVEPASSMANMLKKHHPSAWQESEERND